MISLKLKIKERILKDKVERSTYSSEPYYDHYDRALEGIEDNVFFIIAAEPGSGKSRGLYHYVRQYLDRARLPADTGIVIFVSTRAEIHSFIKGAKLAGGEFGVVTAASPLADAKEYGGMIDPTKAPVVFVTSQYVYAHCPDSFSEFDRLLYRGKPRALRLWDEGFYKASSALIPMDHLAAIKGALRGGHRDLVAVIEKAEAEIRIIGVGGTMALPLAIKGLAAGARAAGVSLTKPQEEALRGLEKLAGKVVRVCQGWNEARYLAGEDRRLPNDLAPLFVFDASARVSPVYEIMADAGVPIVRLPVKTVSYCEATFHHMKLGAGRTLMACPANREQILAEAAAVLNVNDEEECLVIYNKIDDADVMRELRAITTNPDRLKFVYWGNHRASNEFRNIRKVLCIGLLEYPEFGYDRQHIECAGKMATRPSDLVDLQAGERRSRLLQAITRSNIRHHYLGICGKCDVYVIAWGKNVEPDLRKAFPGCRYESWKQSRKPLTSRAAEVYDIAVSHLSADGVASVKKTAIYKLMGISRFQFAALIKDEKLVSALKAVGITALRSTFEINDPPAIIN